MPSVTGWTRLEPRTRGDDMTDALEARIHDPAWLLGRQWQVGEFQGSDGGSPVSAAMAATSSQLTRYLPGPFTEDAEGRAYDGRTPLETTVEREPVRTAADENLRLAAETGARFLSSLAEESEAAHEALRGDFIEAYPLDPSSLYGSDVLDIHGLAARLSGDDLDPVSRFVRGAVTEETRLLLDAHEPGGPGDALRGALIDDLNDVIGDGSLYDEVRFADVSIPEEAADLLDRASRETLPVSARTHLDRLLLAAAYPGVIRSEDERDPASVRFLRIVGRRVPDGTRLYAALESVIPAESGGTVEWPDEPTVPDEHREATAAAARAWLDWYGALFSEPGEGETAWRTEQLEYEFSVAAPTDDGELVLEAREYAGGTLDWHDFSARPDASLGAAGDADGDGDGPVSTTTATVIPAPVEYRGMPAPRFWEFEERGVRFGDVSAEPTDLPHLLLAEFALVYGNNWFVVPFDLPVGTLSRVTSLRVVDTFGVERTIGHVDDGPGAPDWELFTLSGPAGGSRRELFLPPVIADRFESDPLEEVRFIRDETANMAWGIERTVAGLGGLPVNRAEAAHRETAIPPPPVQDTLPKYRLASSVPEHWIPLVAVPDEGARRGRAIRLRRAGILQPETREITASRGRILESDAEFVVDEEAVPRAGIQVTRRYQHARGTDGGSYLWIGRQKRPGRGEGSSGLRFDEVEEGTED